MQPAARICVRRIQFAGGLRGRARSQDESWISGFLRSYRTEAAAVSSEQTRVLCWCFWDAAIIHLVKDQVSSERAEAETAITDAPPDSYYPMDKTSQRTAIPGLSKDDAAAAVTGNVGSEHCLRLLLLLLSTYVACYCWAQQQQVGG